ncbi:hypothetical protein EA473_16415 [Natrarchaeobius chitinivorans]|uniref:Uncharacterized protein n=1 Tax=Natrarchaeobius chitinivorans TaxID=1679083 RepID=A0A3N6LUM0_NATCH|nr:hypothetical protein EA473_16415 [Natrarchaeobius chitinivorans]
MKIGRATAAVPEADGRDSATSLTSVRQYTNRQTRHRSVSHFVASGPVFADELVDHRRFPI